MAPTNDAAPRIGRLVRDLAGAVGVLRERVVAEFWDEAERAGTPLVEPAGGGRCWVTFLWRRGVDDAGLAGPVEPVMVMGGPALWWEIPNNVLKPVPDTDISYRSYLVDDDLRGRYILSPGDPLTDLPAAGTPESVMRSAGFRPDPRNRDPLTLTADPADPVAETGRYSTFALPGATPRTWCEPRPGVPTGALSCERLASTVLGNTRRVWIYRPPSGPRATDPAALVMLDGRDWVEWVPLASTLDNLIADRLIPPMTVILPEALDTATRYRELTANPQFTQFLTDELLPWAGEQVSMPTDPTRMAVHGKSFGGLAAVAAAWSRPDLFGAALSQSGSFWFAGWDGGTEEILPGMVAGAERRGPGAGVRVSLDIGALEGEAMLGSHRRMVDALAGRGYPVREHRYHGGHDINCWISELPAALRWWTDPLC